MRRTRTEPRDMSNLLKELFDANREESNRRFDELNVMVNKRFDKIETKLDGHMADDNKNFEALRTEIATSKTEQAVKRRIWATVASVLGLVIGAVGTWIAYLKP